MKGPRKEKRFEIFVVLALLGFGIYQSVLYFGHHPVPNSDFSAFIKSGREILSFQHPINFKRAPVLGILQVSLSLIIDGQSPELTAGWLLNALLHPLNLVLLWLVGREIVGKSAIWIAIIAILNPLVIQLLAQPIAETTLLFFILVTFYFIFKRSRWSYFFALITTMVRYEGAALILAAFVVDMIARKTRKERIITFIYSALASVPLALWLLGTIIRLKGPTGSGIHYLQELGSASGGKLVLVEYLELLWQVGFSSLFKAVPKAPQDTHEILLGLSKLVAAGSFILGAVYGLYKRCWNILALLIFFISYIMVHAIHFSLS